MTLKTPIELLPGDFLLYGKSDVFGLITSIKTWSPAVHVEVYIGGGTSVASRNGIGVNQYNLRTEQLIAVLRPNQPFDISRAMGWFFAKAQGQRYDWKGLLCFTLAVKHGSAFMMFCSEFGKKFAEAGGFYPFASNFPADQVAPGSFFMSPAFDWAWIKSGIRP